MSRTVFIDLTYLNGGVSYGHQTIALTVTRPPVFLIHGFNTDATAWDLFTFSGAFASSHKIYSLNYGNKLYEATYDLEGFPTFFPTSNIDITSSTPSADQLDLYQFARQSHLGIDLNARVIAMSMQTRMHQFIMGDNPLRQPVAAVGADVLAHSMGGLIVRMLATYPDYRSTYNYQQGSLHKLVTLGTPHWGSPQAILSLLPQSSCSRSFASSVGSLAFSTLTFAGSSQTVPGAVGDLQGDGLGISNLSQALTTINLSNVFIPIATIAGDAESLDPLLDNRTNGAFVVRNGCRLSSDPLAERHTSALFDTIFDPNSLSPINMNGSLIPTRNDGSVPLTSALLSNTISTCNPPNCFSGYTHSVGISQLFNFFGVPYVPYLQDGSQEIVTYVETLLNTSIRNQAFSK